MCNLLIKGECGQVIQGTSFLPAAHSPSIIAVSPSFGQQERMRLEKFEGR